MHKVIRYIAVTVATLYATTALAGGLAGISDANTASKTTAASSTAVSSGAANTAPANAPADTNTANDGDGFVAIEDDPLIVDASAIMDDDGMGEVSVQWQLTDNAVDWANISGATHQSFTPRQVNVGRRLRVVITYVDGQGNLETLISPASMPVQNVNDKPTGAPILTGAAREEDALVVDTSTIADEDGISSHDVIWQRSATKTEWQAYPAVQTSVLRLGQEHVGFSYRAIISYVDNHNTREVMISNPSEVVTNVDDPVEGEVTLSGKPIEGGSITAKTNSVSDEDGIASLSLSWEFSKDGRNWRAVDTAANTVIRLDQSLVGMQVRAKASVVDTFGVETLIYSPPTNTVENINNNPIGQINVRRVGS